MRLVTLFVFGDVLVVYLLLLVDLAPEFSHALFQLLPPFYVLIDDSFQLLGVCWRIQEKVKVSRIWEFVNKNKSKTVDINTRHHPSQRIDHVSQHCLQLVKKIA